MIQVLKTFFDFYIKSSIHVGLAVVALAAVTMFEFDLNTNYSLLLFIFFGTVTAYNLIKYATIARFSHRSLSANLRAIQVFSFFCFLGLIYFALQQPPLILIASAIFGLISLLYLFPLSPQSKNLRNVSGIKIFVIAFSWAGVTVVLPGLTGDVIYLYAILLSFIQRALFVLVLTLPFDIRDLGSDEPHLGTIPQIYGEEKARTTGVVLLSLVIFLEIIKIWATVQEIAVLIVIVTVTYWLLRKSTETQSKYFAAFWVEGVPILWWLLLFILNHLNQIQKTVGIWG